ncbi:hypothetical protein EVAR_61917_1 [Eumeta japonica]|uniref:Uncharacterized protein n=1 Tax=Eumeta variegata TaxID=151549 RepID=A0A4C1ZJZ5_EUMVA|nr:hypothetical protein EVAR_61917_1 [Eumeta japonica]
MTDAVEPRPRRGCSDSAHPADESFLAWFYVNAPLSNRRRSDTALDHRSRLLKEKRRTPTDGQAGERLSRRTQKDRKGRHEREAKTSQPVGAGGDSDAMIERAARKMITRQAATEKLPLLEHGSRGEGSAKRGHPNRGDVQ